MKSPIPGRVRSLGLNIRPTAPYGMFSVSVTAYPVTDAIGAWGPGQTRQLEAVEEAEDLIPAQRPDRLAGPFLHRFARP
jgi:hypothetical protein